MLLYTINNNVTFDPESNVLHSKINNKAVNMLTPSGQCLLILLENKGNIVSKRDIYEFVWERYGLTATDNAFYQTVLYLRKNLKEAGLPAEIVKTVPRKGVLVPSSVQVDKIDPQQELQVDSTIVEPVIDQPPIRHDDNKEHDLIVLSDDYPAVESVTTNNIEQNQPTVDVSTVTKKRQRPAYLWPLLIISVLVVSLLIVYWQRPDETADYFSNYTMIAQQEGCSIFINADRTPSDEYISQMEKNPINCQRTPYVYFTKVEFVKRISLIACEKEIAKENKRNECVSYYDITK